jgi:hypothetical protein
MSSIIALAACPWAPIRALRYTCPMNISQTSYLPKLFLVVAALLSIASAEESTLDQLQGTIDTTTHLSATCPTHHLTMTKLKVQISYRLIRFPEPQPSSEVRRSEFPFARDKYLGGCVVRRDAPKYALIYLCPECKTAEKKWYEAHPKK